MKNDGYKIRDQQGIYFITFAVVEWVDVFTRKEYADIIIENLRYCIQHKGLKLYAWCIMSNHVHLIASAEQGNLSDILRDFKKFTSKAIIEAIQNNKDESRKNCLPAGRQGCFGFSKKKERTIVVMNNINFGASWKSQKTIL